VYVSLQCERTQLHQRVPTALCRALGKVESWYSVCKVLSSESADLVLERLGRADRFWVLGVDSCRIGTKSRNEPALAGLSCECGLLYVVVFVMLARLTFEGFD